MTEGSEQPQGMGVPEQQPPAQPPSPQRSGGGAGALWQSPVGSMVADVITNPVSALRAATFAVAIIGLAHLIADMRTADGSRDSVVWATFLIDLFYTVVFVTVLHGLRTIVEAVLKK